MYNKVLLAIDGSAESKAATRVARDYLLQGLAKELIVINVSPNFDSVGFEISLTRIEKMNEMGKLFGQKIVAEALKQFPPDANVKTEVILGDPAMSICDYARDEGCDLIIMGSRGRNPISGLFLGSVSTRVLHFASCPVLIVKN